MDSANVVQLPRTATFDDFWAAYPYPRRVGKPLAKAKWDAITNGGLRTRTFDKDSNSYVTIELTATPQEIIEGVKRYAEKYRSKVSGESWKFVDDGKYLCHPATFLNQGRWLDA